MKPTLMFFCGLVLVLGAPWMAAYFYWVIANWLGAGDPYRWQLGATMNSLFIMIAGVVIGFYGMFKE